MDLQCSVPGHNDFPPLFFARYNHRLSEISARAGSTFPNFVWEVCSNSRRLFTLSPSLSQLDRWELYCVLVIHTERERERRRESDNILRAVLFQTRKSASIFCYLASPSGEICNAVQKHYVNRLPRLILTGRKIKQWIEFSFRCFILDKRWWKCVPLLIEIQLDL